MKACRSPALFNHNNLSRALYNCLDHVFSSKKAGRVLVPIHKSNTILIDWLNAAGFTLAQNILSKPGYVLYLLGKPADR